jgi:hypothetical protein
MANPDTITGMGTSTHWFRALLFSAPFFLALDLVVGTDHT